MRVAVLRRNVIAARRARAWPAKCLARERSEAEAGARPASEAARIERVDVGREPAHEIVVEAAVVELDNGDRQRR